MDGDVRVRREPVRERRASGKRSAQVHEVHLLGKLRQHQRLLHGRIAAADHDHVLALVERAVAVRTVRDAVLLKLRLAGHAQGLQSRPRGDDHAARLQFARVRADDQHLALAGDGRGAGSEVFYAELCSLAV